jgi:hypothetical protein
MKRRDFVKVIAAVPAAVTVTFAQQTTTPPPEAAPVVTPQGATPPAGAPAVTAPPAPGYGGRGFQFTPPPPITAAVPDAVAATEAHFFSAQQLSALRKLSGTLVPPLNGYPGAVEAGVPEFLDFLISVSPADHQQIYVTGLDRLNADAKKQFEKPFAEVSPEQADALIRPGLAVWTNNSPPAEPFKRFISVAHRDIRTATTNSQAWNAAAVAAGERAPGVGLYWTPIDPDVEQYS